MNPFSMHIVNLKKYYCSEIDVVTPPIPPFWNRVRTGGKEQFSRVNRGGGASLNSPPKAVPHQLPQGYPWGEMAFLYFALQHGGWCVVPQVPVYHNSLYIHRNDQ